MIKVIFFDLDGTLLSHTGEPVRESTRRAMKQLARKGIKRICCTGRNIGELAGFDLHGLEFDGYYTDNGQAFYDSQLNPVSFKYLSDEQADELVSFFDLKLLPTLLATPEKLILNYANDQVREVLKRIDVPGYEVGSYCGEKLLNGVVYASREQEKMIMTHLPNAILARWDEQAADVVYNPGGKADAVREYQKMNGLAREEIAAFGDSHNDLSMLQAAGLSVAMGNSVEELKNVADYVAADIDDDGIYLALKHLNLI